MKIYSIFSYNWSMLSLGNWIYNFKGNNLNVLYCKVMSSRWICVPTIHRKEEVLIILKRLIII